MRKYSDGGTTDYSHYVTAVAALLNQQGDILILQRGSTAPWMPNAWSLVGGVVDEGENPDEAIVREIMEETGLVAHNLQYRQTKYTKDAGKIVYYVGMLPANFIVRLDYENQDFAFVNLSNIDQYEYVPHVKAFMRNLLEPPTQMIYHKKPKLAEGGIVKKYGFTEAEIDKWEKENKVSQRKTQNPVVKEAITEMAEGKLTQDEYLKILQENNPIKPFDRVPPLPTLKEIVGSLKTNQLEKQGIIGHTVEIPDGAYVASRLDIPAYDNYDVWVVSVHDGNKEGNVIGYAKTAYLKNVTFKSSPKTAMRIGMGLSTKSTFARMFGTWVNKSPEVVRNMAVRYMNNPNWIQVGMNPYRHSWFYDKADGLPLVSADEVIQVGALVLAKNAVKTTVDDPAFIVDDKNPAIKYSEGGKTGSVYYRATSEDLGMQTVFTPINRYEAFDEEGNPLTRGSSDVFVLSDKPEISASKTIGGAVLGLWSMFNHNGINPVGKKIYIYEIMDRPRKDLSHVRMADFEYLKEVRYDKPVNGERVGYFVFDTEFNNNALNFYGRLYDDDPYSETQYDEDAWNDFEKYIFTLNINDIVRYADGGKTETLLAPNGKPSNLTPEQWHLVRTPAFKAWFGDWENNPQEASKVVDENGEPLVVYHGTYLYKGYYTEFNNISYFTDNKNTAKKYPIDAYVFYETFDEYVDDFGLDETDIQELKKHDYDVDKLQSGNIMVREDDWLTIWKDYDPNKLFVYECFLNLRNPKIFENADNTDITYITDADDERIIDAVNQNYNSIIGIYPYKWFSIDKTNYNRQIIGDYEKEKHFVTFYSNQIKLADGSNTTFDGSNPDIRFAKGGKTETIRPYSSLDISRVKKGVVHIDRVHPKRITKIDDLPI